MKESYNRQANYPMGKPFTTDVMRDTLKSVERKSENNRYSSLGNLMPAVAWPVTITGLYETTGVTAWEIFRIKISSGGIVDLTDTKSSRIKFYPTLSYPANVNNTEGGTEVPTSFAIYMAGATPTRSSLTIYPVDSYAYGDMYTKDVVFTFAHDSGLAAGTVTCTADSNSSELLPNSNLVYYAWTITYATGVTVEDLRTYLTSGTPTLFATYFACVAYHETPGSPAVLPQATTKTIFFMQQGLTVTMDLTCTARLMAGVQYILTAAYDTTLAPHELAIYIKLSYDTDVRDNVTYYSHMEKFPKNSYTTLAATSIVYSWEMSTEESDQQNLIPFMYRENDNTVVFLDGTRFYKDKMTNGSFKPNSDVRTYELGGFSILGADGTLIDINSSGQVGELELINEAGMGFYSLISRVWWYATDAVYTFYRHDSASPRPAFSINRTSGQVIIGGGLDIATTIVIESPYNTHALTTLVPAGETLCTVYATDGTAGLRSTLLFGQNGQTKYSTLMQMTQADSTSDAGLYLVTQLDKLFIGLHSNANADILVTGAGKPYIEFTTDSIIMDNGSSNRIMLFGASGGTPEATMLLAPGASVVTLLDPGIVTIDGNYTITSTPGVELKSYNAAIRLADDGIIGVLNILSSDYINIITGSNYTSLKASGGEVTLNWAGGVDEVGATHNKLVVASNATYLKSTVVHTYTSPTEYTANAVFVDAASDDVPSGPSATQLRLFAGESQASTEYVHYGMLLKLDQDFLRIYAIWPSHPISTPESRAAIIEPQEDDLRFCFTRLGSLYATYDISSRTGFQVDDVRVVGAQVPAPGLDAKSDSAKITDIIAALRLHGLLGPD